MRLKARFALALVILVLAVGAGVALLGVGVWSSVPPADQAVITRVLREQTAFLAIGALLVVAGLGALLAVFFKLYVAPPRRLAAEARLIASANPDHRIQAQGPGEVRQLVAAVNELADRYRSARSDVERQIADARASLEQERNRLAALMSELTLAVLVCNVEGRILLYNAAARRLLDEPAGVVGLGRSVFGIVDRRLIVHGLEVAAGDGSARAHPATAVRGDKLLRVHIAPVAATSEELAGFVLTLEDMTRQAEAGERRGALLRALTEGTRASLASIRAAVESMLDYPEMDADQRRRFLEIIWEEATGLSTHVEQAIESSGSPHDRWLLTDMLDRELVRALGRRLEDEAGLRVSIDEPGSERWLQVDSFVLIRAVTQFAGRLKAERGVDEVRLAMRAVGRHAELDLRWRGAPVDTETLRAGTGRPAGPAGPGAASTLGEVIERHGGELWCGQDETGHGAYARLLLPLAEVAPGPPPAPPARSAVPDESRPQFYDFDLFALGGQAPAWDERRLDELAYTVFDTETTGLSPSEGDEIISIGAIRIVNGRLLRQETFEQLVDPRRPVPVTSQRVHGISPELLEGQPTIEEVLPAFARFAEDTVLVGHNVAFDMRFVQLKEGQTGVRLTQPVLDTLLLSAVVHPDHDDHSLEAMAARLGVSVIGRHTALGDAILTGELFLKLLRLLVAQGVATLGEAREAARRTYQARVSDSLYTRG